jgi:glc operon protein GlcG
LARLTLSIARAIADAAFQEAATLNVAAITIVVVDPGGTLLLAMRSENQGIFGIDIASAKAVTALAFKRSSLKSAEAFTSPAVVAGLAGATGGRFLPLGGGVAIFDADGNLLGAAAVAGSLPQTDHAVISAAVARQDLRASE